MGLGGGRTKPCEVSRLSRRGTKIALLPTAYAVVRLSTNYGGQAFAATEPNAT